MNTFLRRLSSDIPLLSADAIDFLIGIQLTADDFKLSEHPYLKELRQKCETKMEINGSVAIVPIQGPLAHNPDPYEMAMGVEDSRHVLKMIHAAKSDKGVSGVLLRMDTPGGMMVGGPEMSDAVMECRKSGKPVIAHIGGYGASLGYMIASQANHVMAHRSAIVGSIGVMASITDYSALLAKVGIKVEHLTNKDAKFKAVGAMGTSLTGDQRDYLQGRLESTFQVFKSAVMNARPTVKPESMQGQTFRGSEALAMNLIDSIGSESTAISMLRR